MRVKDPDGRTWRVTRRWVPWRRRLKGVLSNTPDLPMGLGDDPVSAIIGVLVLIIMIPFLILFLIAGLELLVVVLLLPLAIGLRFVSGRPWYVEARLGYRPVMEIEAGSWASSRKRIVALADQIRRGNTPASEPGP